MTDDRTGKPRPQEPSKPKPASTAQEPERKPSPIEREWRGSGVCGDRHTD